MGWARSVESDHGSGSWSPSTASGGYLTELAPAHSFGRCASACPPVSGCYKTSSMDYGRFYSTVPPKTERRVVEGWAKRCDLLQRSQMNCWDELKKRNLSNWPGFAEDFPITSKTSIKGSREGHDKQLHKAPWQTNADNGSIKMKEAKERAPSPRRFGSFKYPFF